MGILKVEVNMVINSIRNGGILRRVGTLGLLLFDLLEYSLYELILMML